MNKTVRQLGLLLMVVMTWGCTAQPPSYTGVALAAQSTPAPALSALDQPSLLPAAHQRYMHQSNALQGATQGALWGAGMGQAVGRDTESTAYGTAAGALLGSGIAR